MKKLVSCLLVVVMLFTAMSAFAAPVETDNILTRFLKETDLETKDIALQAELGDKLSEIVIRSQKDHLHLVERLDGQEEEHVLLTPEAIYLSTGGVVTMLKYSTVQSVIDNIGKTVKSMIEQVLKSIPEESLPTDAEVAQATEEAAAELAAEVLQAQADAGTLTSAALDYVSKFKPEYVLDVKAEEGSVQVSLRSEAYATALSEAMDSLMTNPALAELVNRKAAENGGATFAEIQRNWLANREATLEAIRTVENTEKLEENGHWTSHFQIGEETEETKPLVCDSDAWIDVENGEIEIRVTLGEKDEAAILVYESTLSPEHYSEKMTSGNSVSDIRFDLRDGEIISGAIRTVIDDVELLSMNFGEYYLNMKGPKAAISTTVRETWTGKLRYELFIESAEGESFSLILDFYEDGDSLVCEMKTSGSDQYLKLKVARIDRIEMAELDEAKDVVEITENTINALLEFLLKVMVPEQNAPEAAK